LETEPTRMCALLVGLPDVTVVGVGEWPHWLRIVIVTEVGPSLCCGVLAHRHGVREVELVDLPVFGRPARLVGRKQRWRCVTCRRTWTAGHIASSRCAMTTRAARWATIQVGRHGRTVSEVAAEFRSRRSCSSQRRPGRPAFVVLGLLAAVTAELLMGHSSVKTYRRSADYTAQEIIDPLGH
jgi:zinc-finger of transposase IS204/IS1001/IS1096/IS1165